MRFILGIVLILCVQTSKAGLFDKLGEVLSGIKGISSSSSPDISKWDLSGGDNVFLTKVAAGSLVEVKEMISSNDKIIYGKNKSGLNAIHIATMKQNSELLGVILSNKEFSKLVDERVDNIDGDALGTMTALCMSSRIDKDGAITKLLINAGADVNARCGNLDYIPIQFAVSWNNTNIIGLLVDAGANIYVKANQDRLRGSLIWLNWHDNLKTKSFDGALTLLDALKRYGEKNSIPDIQSSMFSEVELFEYIKDEKGMMRRDSKGEFMNRLKEVHISDSLTDAGADLTPPFPNWAYSSQDGKNPLQEKFNLKRLNRKELNIVIDKWYNSLPFNVRKSIAKPKVAVTHTYK